MLGPALSLTRNVQTSAGRVLLGLHLGYVKSYQSELGQQMQPEETNGTSAPTDPQLEHSCKVNSAKTLIYTTLTGC